MTIEPKTSPCCHHEVGSAWVEAMEHELARERTLLQHWQLLRPGVGHPQLNLRAAEWRS